MNVSFYQEVSLKKLLTLSFFYTVMYLYYQVDKPQIVYNVMDETLPEWIYFSLEEVTFPIAFSISVERDYEQFYRLFKVIYRPFNMYCIHVDLAGNETIMSDVVNLTAEYNNVIIPKRFVNTQNNSFGVLESELLCMEALSKHKSIQWKYFINLSGQEWPLKVNLEIVRILKQLNGANLIEKLRPNIERFPNGSGDPPHRIKPWKGAMHIIASRDFIRFALCDTRAQDFLQYLHKTDVPEETYFSTLNHDHKLRAPGGYTGNRIKNLLTYPFLNRHKIWKTEGECYGEFIQNTCVFAMEDVPSMITVENKKFFANKFVKGINDDVLNLMERWLYNRSRAVYSNTRLNPFINLTYYSQLTVVNNHF